MSLSVRFISHYFSTTRNYFQIDSSLEHSLAPHIVTTPIAMAISEMIGGMSQLTAVFVVLTALTGALLGPSLIRIFRIKTAIAKVLC